MTIYCSNKLEKFLGQISPKFQETAGEIKQRQNKMNSKMEQKIQLKHPEGKKTISMDTEKYGVIEKSLLNCLKARGESTHKEILKTIAEEFKKNKIKFDGSIEWHMEWVKLDLEARKKITRIADTIPVKFKLA